MFDRDLITSYLNYSQPIGSTRRYGKCPYCGTIKRLGFVVTRTTTGFVCWCHGCHKSYSVGGHTPSSSECFRSAGELKARLIQRRQKQLTNDTKTILRTSVHMPYDVTDELPTSSLVWLRMYNITQQEINKYGLCWSPSLERLILPVRDKSSKLVYWQGRYFGRDRKQPKYINTKCSRGDVWFDTGDDATTTVLVEDILSAIAISRTGKARAIALLGSFVSDNLIVKLLSEDRQVCVWLDRDKRHDALAFTKRLNVFGITAKTISTVNDPKCYKATTIIKEIQHVYPQLSEQPAVQADGRGSDQRIQLGGEGVHTDDRFAAEQRERENRLASSSGSFVAGSDIPAAENCGFCFLQCDSCIPERTSLRQETLQTQDIILERLLVAGYLFEAHSKAPTVLQRGE